MHKITRVLVAAATAVLALTGCGMTPQPNAAKPFTPSEVTLDEFFLMRVNSGWLAKERTGDEQLSAGMRACEQIAAGVPRFEVLALDEVGDPLEHDNAVIVYHAAYILCPAIL